MQQFYGFDYSDSLNAYLLRQIFPQLGIIENENSGIIEVRRLKGSNRVYLYSLNKNDSDYKVVGKFFGDVLDSPTRKKLLLIRELEKIQRLKELGFHDGKYQVVRCLGYSETNDYVLIMNYADGHQLDYIIKRGILQNRMRKVHNALADLACFLQLLHSRTTLNEIKVDFAEECEYAYKTLHRLENLTSNQDIQVLSELVERWKSKPEMLSVSSAQVHGDCTPTNFIFSKDPKVIALDFERSRRSDPAFDTGRVAGELIHHFIMFTGEAKEAEPLITHFYKEYCSYASNPNQLFDDITKRNPFYQAVTELRIAKNNWVSSKHRQILIDEAKKCLRY